VAFVVAVTDDVEEHRRGPPVGTGRRPTYADAVPMPTEVAGVVAELVVHDRQLTFCSA
jgi:hypothetical protein